MNKKIVLVLSAAALIILVAFLWQRMSFSKEVLKLEIIGPETASLGEELEYILKFKNNGAIRLESPELFFEFPEGSIFEGEGRIKRMTAEQLGGDIYPGEERTFKFQGRLLGKENETKTIKAIMSFQPKDLKSRNEVSTTFTTILDEIPIDFSLDMPSKTGGGKAFTFKINYSSNVNYPLNDLSCIIQYPDDFEFLYSQPKAMEDSQWDIPILNEAGAGKIEVSGVLNGDPGEQEVFKARIGIWQEGNFILLKEAVKGMEIASSSLYMTQRINNSEEYIASPGDQLHYEIFFRNLSEQPMTNLVLIARLEGSGLDLNSIKAPDGKFQAGDNSIIWEKIVDLEFLDAGKEGKVEFWVDVKQGWTIKNLAEKNPVIKNKITIGEARQEFLTKIGTNLGAEQKLYAEDRHFENPGPYPLEAGQKTYFTIEWTATSSFSDMGSVVMNTILPENVVFEGKTWPEGVELEYNADTSELVWVVGTVEAGAGTLKQARTCAFQLSVEPQTTEQDIILLGSAQISGTDEWTGQKLTAKTEMVYGEVKK
ncbi:MAG: hypothetical protein PHO90_00355 [Candidatus Pacebacteria bacterium]|nr:hypothetical protein [Candidatus Paceibacterota bacterium]